ncbi:hypothetical protein D3C76_42350 [compost metagenome]
MSNLASSLTRFTSLTLPVDVTPSWMLGLMSMATRVRGSVVCLIHWNRKTTPISNRTEAATELIVLVSLMFRRLTLPFLADEVTEICSPNPGSTSGFGRLRKVPSSQRTTMLSFVIFMTVPCILFHTSFRKRYRGLNSLELFAGINQN